MRVNTGTLKEAFTKSANEVIANKNKLLFMLLFILGLFFGKTLYLNNTLSFGNLISEFFGFITASKLSSGLAVLFALNALLPVITFFNGFNALGLPVITIIPSIFGVVSGAVISYLYAQYNLNGVFFSVISIIPFSVVAVLFVIASCNSSLKLSCKTAKSVLLGESTNRGEVRSFLISHLIMLVVILVSSFLQFLLISKLAEKLLVF